MLSWLSLFSPQCVLPFTPLLAGVALAMQFQLNTYTLLVKGPATSLRVADALKMIDCICRVGASPGEEVPFGKVVRCPSCFIAVSVAQPQQSIQIVSCSKCSYQYELVSGNITTLESEEIRWKLHLAWQELTGSRLKQLTSSA